MDIADKVAKRFHTVEDKDYREVKDLISMSENPDGKWNTIAIEHVDIQMQQKNLVQALVVKQAKCNSLVQHAFNEICYGGT